MLPLFDVLAIGPISSYLKGSFLRSTTSEYIYAYSSVSRDITFTDSRILSQEKLSEQRRYCSIRMFDQIYGLYLDYYVFPRTTRTVISNRYLRRLFRYQEVSTILIKLAFQRLLRVKRTLIYRAESNPQIDFRYRTIINLYQILTYFRLLRTPSIIKLETEIRYRPSYTLTLRTLENTQNKSRKKKPRTLVLLSKTLQF